MPPKKEVKKEPQPPPEEQAPVIPPHELEGYGKFQYVDGTVYEGSWRLFDGVKMKHGQGLIKIPGSSYNNLGGESYEGSWEEDKMSGYGQYKYANGAIYRGEWKQDKHHGKGEYQFPNGTCYIGEWEDHLMHGPGYYIDEQGHKWDGEFRSGKYESKLQKELAKERQIIIRKASMIKEIEELLNAMLEAIAKSDKKTLKDNFGPFFPSGDVIKEQVKQPYCKMDERPPEKWTQVLNIIKTNKINPLSSSEESVVLGSERMLKPQLEGPGQIVQIASIKDQRTIKAAFVNVEANVWFLCAFTDEEKKK